MIVAGTGHRPQKLGGYGPNPLARAISTRIGEELDRLRPERVISGMALGVDQWLAWLAVRRGIPFTAALPFTGQFTKWSQEQKEKYGQLLELCSAEVDTSLGHACDRCHRTDWRNQMRHLYQVRNEWMVDRCTVLIAVWDGSNSGTGNCVRYAENVGRPLVRINPRELNGETRR